jgi:ribose 5-phosphate isomerase A
VRSDGRAPWLASPIVPAIFYAMNPKQRAAEAAMGFLHDEMVIGLGTGSTADFFLQALGSALKEGRLHNIVGVATSLQSERRSRELGIPLSTLAQSPRLDVTIDGADEVDPQLDLIKGLGGALLREKIVAQNSKRLIIIADASKAVTKLGTKSPLPVEVAQFAHETQETYLKGLGATPTLRRGADGSVFVTDNGNYIFDCRFAAGIDDPRALSTALRERAGIVESGLFLGLTTVALIAGDAEVQVRKSDRAD